MRFDIHIWIVTPFRNGLVENFDLELKLHERHEVGVDRKRNKELPQYKDNVPESYSIKKTDLPRRGLVVYWPV